MMRATPKDTIRQTTVRGKKASGKSTTKKISEPPRIGNLRPRRREKDCKRGRKTSGACQAFQTKSRHRTKKKKKRHTLARAGKIGKMLELVGLSDENGRCSKG